MSKQLYIDELRRRHGDSPALRELERRYIRPEPQIDPEIQAKQFTSSYLADEMGLDVSAVSASYDSIVEAKYGSKMKPTAVLDRMERDGIVMRPESQNRFLELDINEALEGKAPTEEEQAALERRKLVKTTADYFSYLDKSENAIPVQNYGVLPMFPPIPYRTGRTLTTIQDIVDSKPSKPDEVFEEEPYTEDDLLDISTFTGLLKDAKSKEQAQGLYDQRKVAVQNHKAAIMEQQEEAVMRMAASKADTNAFLEFYKGLESGTQGVKKRLASASVAMGMGWNAQGVQDAKDAMARIEMTPSEAAGVLGYVSNTVGQTLPYFATMAVGGMGTTFLTEFGNAYGDAIDAGMTEAEAQLEGVAIGIPVTYIESLQLDKWFKFARAGKTSFVSFRNALKNRMYAEIIKSGGRAVGEGVKLALNEGIEELLQEGVQLTVPAITRGEYPQTPEGKVDWSAIGENMLGAFTGGSIGGLFLGGAGKVFNAAQIVDAKKHLTAAIAIRESMPYEEAKEKANEMFARREQGLPFNELYQSVVNPEIYQEYLSQKKALKQAAKQGTEGERGTGDTSAGPAPETAQIDAQEAASSEPRLVPSSIPQDVLDRAKTKADKSQKPYYIWTDDQGKSHLTQSKPKTDDYKTINPTLSAQQKARQRQIEAKANENMPPKRRNEIQKNLKKSILRSSYQSYLESNQDMTYNLLQNFGRKLDFGANYSDIKDYIEGKPYLWNYVAAKGQKGQPWDDFFNEAKEKTGKDVTDPREAIEMIDQAAQGAVDEDGFNRQALQEAMKNDDLVALEVMLYDQNRQGFSEEELTQSLKDFIEGTELKVNGEITLDRYFSGELFNVGTTEEINTEVSQEAEGTQGQEEAEAEAVIKEDDDFSDFFDFGDAEKPKTGKNRKEAGFLSNTPFGDKDEFYRKMLEVVENLPPKEDPLRKAIDANRASNPATKDQKARAHIIQNEDQISDDEYRSIAEMVTGKTSTKDMTVYEVERFINTLRPQKKSLGEAFYEENAGKGRIPISEKVNLDKIKLEVAKAIGIMSDRLRRISPKLFHKVKRDFIFKSLHRTSEMVERARPFVEGMEKASAEDQAKFDLASLIGEPATDDIMDIIVRNGLEKEYNEYRKVMDEIYEMAFIVGMDIDYRPMYFARKVKDFDGLMKYLERTEYYSIIETALRNREASAGRELTKEEQSHIVNTLLRGYRTQHVSLATTGNVKAREIAIIDKNIAPYYHNWKRSLADYIHGMNVNIAARQFFGKESREVAKIRGQISRAKNRVAQFEAGTVKAKDGETFRARKKKAVEKLMQLEQDFQKKNLNFLNDSIGAIVLEERTAGRITPNQEKELRGIFEGIFSPKSPHGWIASLIKAGYVSTLSQVTNAITQAGELVYSELQDPIRANVNYAKAWAGKSNVKLNEITGGLGNVQEWTDAGFDKAGKAMLSMMTKVNDVGFETFINTAIEADAKLARTNPAKLKKRLEFIYGPETDSVILDLLGGKITENVKYLAFAELSEIQPVSIMEMPEYYAKAGNLRVFYMLKTFTIKRMNVIWNTARNDMESGEPGRILRGLSRASWLVFWLLMADTAIDAIKDLIRGKPFNPADAVIDNMLQMIMLSKYDLNQLSSEGVGGTVGNIVSLPTPFSDALLKDMVTLFDENSEKGSELARRLPYIGEFYYWWAGEGARKIEEGYYED